MKIAVTKNGRCLPAAWTIRLISSGSGISTPAFSLFLPRRSRLIDTSSATFCATLPRRLAFFNTILRAVKTFAAIARDRFATRSSRKSLTRGVVSLASFSRPMRGMM